MSKARPKGWHVEIDHDSGHTHKPQVVGQPTKNPTVNGLPKIEIPVRRGEKWQDSGFEDAPMRVWHKGERQPIEELRRIRITEGETVLVGWGGVELEQRIQKNYDYIAAHTAIDNAVQNKTSYATNVDTPDVPTYQDVPIQEVDTTNEWNNFFPLDANQPFNTDNGTLGLEQGSWLMEAEDSDARFPDSTTSDSDASDGGCVSTFVDSHYINATFTVPYDMELEPSVRLKSTNTDNVPGFKITIDGTTVYDIQPDGYLIGFYSWIENTGNPVSVNAGDSVEIRFLIDDDKNSSADPVRVDAIGFHDANLTNALTFPDSLDSNNLLAGPEVAAPNGETIEGELSTSGLQVTAGELTSAGWNDLSSDQEVAITNDGTNFITASGSSSVSGSFSSDSLKIGARFNLNPHGSRSNAIPTQDYQLNEVDSYTLTADLDAEPVVNTRSFDTSLLDMMQTICRENNLLFEVQWDDSANGISIEVSTPGQRVASEDSEIVRYDVEKQTEDQVKHATVFGSAQKRRSKFGTGSSLGVLYSLDADHIVDNSETVTDGQTDDQYERGVDYFIDYLNGNIKFLEGGDVPTNSNVILQFNYKTRGSWEDQNASNPVEETFDIPGLTSDSACEHVASLIIDKASEPLWEATVTIPKDPVGWSVISAINPSKIPASQNLQINEITETPEKLVLRLESRRRASDIVTDIRSQVGSVTRRV